MYYIKFWWRIVADIKTSLLNWVDIQQHWNVLGVIQNKHVLTKLKLISTCAKCGYNRTAKDVLLNNWMEDLL